MTYQQATIASTSKTSSPRRKRTVAPATAVPRSRPSPRTPTSASSHIHQLPDLPAAVTCDATHKRLSVEAQLMQDQARDSYNSRLSNVSDRESLRCLESVQLHTTISKSQVDRNLSHKPYTSRILPKYFPSSPRKPRSLRFDQDAPQTTLPTNSSGQPLKSIQGEGTSFSDDSELLQDDDDFFLDLEKEVGDFLPPDGISLFAHLEDIRVKEARGGLSPSSTSSSLPRVLSEGTTDSGEGGPDGAVAMAGDEGEEGDREGWLHVDSMVLKGKIAEEEQQQPKQDAKSGNGEDVVGEALTESVMVENLVGARSMSESGSVDWHADPAQLSEALQESGSNDLAIDDYKVSQEIADSLTVEQATNEGEDGNSSEIFQETIQYTSASEKDKSERLITCDEDLEEADEWLHVGTPDDELDDDDF